MSSIKMKGYRAERKIRMLFDKYGWKTVRSGASLGEADIICLKAGRCVLVQVKSTKRKKLYYYDYMEPKLEGMSFYLVVDFGYGKIRILEPTKMVTAKDGDSLINFLEIELKRSKK